MTNGGSRVPDVFAAAEFEAVVALVMLACLGLISLLFVLSVAIPYPLSARRSALPCGTYFLY